jgi:hypothetical protein
MIQNEVTLMIDPAKMFQELTTRKVPVEFTGAEIASVMAALQLVTEIKSKTPVGQLGQLAAKSAMQRILGALRKASENTQSEKEMTDAGPVSH